jgi:hypothetical protein
MIDLVENWTLLIVGCTALVLAGVLAVLVVRRKEAQRRQLVAVSEVTRDWRTTWKINAVADARVMEHEKDDIPSNFVLRIEENRMVRDIGGGEVMETRWRPPTKAEVREIVRRYHGGTVQGAAVQDDRVREAAARGRQQRLGSRWRGGGKGKRPTRPRAGGSSLGVTIARPRRSRNPG